MLGFFPFWTPGVGIMVMGSRLFRVGVLPTGEAGLALSGD